MPEHLYLQFHQIKWTEPVWIQSVKRTRRSMMSAHGITDVGCVREKNEDRIFIDDSRGLYIVADGMGGHTHGELAAELAISTIQHYIGSSRDRFDVTWP